METKKLDTEDLQRATSNRLNNPWGFFGHEVREKDKIDKAFLIACNQANLTYDQMVLFGESRLGRHLGDTLAYTSDDKRELIYRSILDFFKNTDEDSNNLTIRSEAASRADKIWKEIAEGVARLGDKATELHRAWDEAGYSKDDRVRDDTLVSAVAILGDIAALEKGDSSVIRNLVDNIQDLLDTLSDMAIDLEEEI